MTGRDAVEKCDSFAMGWMTDVGGQNEPARDTNTKAQRNRHLTDIINELSVTLIICDSIKSPG